MICWHKEILELYVYREKDRGKIGGAYKNGHRDLSVVKKEKKKKKRINDTIRRDLWDQASSDTIPRQNKTIVSTMKRKLW